MSRQIGKSAKPSTALFSKRKRADSAALSLASKRPNARASAQNILQDAGRFLQPGLPASVTLAQSQAAAATSSIRLNSARHSQAGASSRTLKSAFRPPPPASGFQWSRDVPLADYRFTCSTAQYQPSGEVRITRVSENLQVISIAEDWLKGEEMWEKKEPHYKTGFIGRGYTKRGIYVRFFFRLVWQLS